MRPIIFYLLFLLLFFGCKTDPPPQEEKSPQKPNFLFLFADDQAFRSIGALNNDEIKTPALDKLTEEGLTFTHCFNQGAWNGAVCIASRAMLNTGQYIYHAQQNINTAKLWGEVFTEAGYETYITGKWHNGDKTALRSFKYIEALGKGMFETRGGPKGPGYHRPTADNNSWTPYDTALAGHWSPEVQDLVVSADSARSLSKRVVKQHTSGLYADNAIQFLNKAKEMEAPFLMYVAFNAPHDPRQSPKEFVDMYPTAGIAIPPNYVPEHPFDQGDHKLRDEILAPFPRTEEVVKVHRQEYYAIISHMDYQISRIMQALEASGLKENTYVIFSADHGLAVGEHGLMGKQNQYEHSIRMPFIISGPGINKGKIEALIYLQSLFATTCELAGIPVPESVDFPSLNPLIKGEKTTGQEYIYGSYRHLQRMVRNEQHKLILYPHIGKVQFFDVINDPFEMNDLSDQPEQKGLMDSCFAALVKLQQSVGDTLTLKKVW